MGFREKAKIMDAEAMARTILRVSHEILEHNKGTESLAVVGIRNRGVFLAERIAKYIKEIDKATVPLGALDITLYRDDLTAIGPQPLVRKTEIDFDITDMKVVLVDDVLFTGRTVRCALDALTDFGRPRNIRLAVLVDRGHRELPIRADYVGKNVPTSLSESVQVKLKETDGVDEVVLLETVE
jgi:pyrimidine operon attenuation protein/uracil phosphoribosyltransferase